MVTTWRLDRRLVYVARDPVGERDLDTPVAMPTMDTKFGRRRLQGKHVGLAVLSVCSMTGNSCLIFTITRHRHLRTASNVLVVSLAIADFLFGFPAAPLYIRSTSSWSSRSPGCSPSRWDATSASCTR